MEPEKKPDTTPASLPTPENLLTSGDEGLIEPAHGEIGAPAEPVTPIAMPDSTTPDDIIEIVETPVTPPPTPTETIAPVTTTPLRQGSEGGTELTDVNGINQVNEPSEEAPKIGYYTPTEVVKTVPVYAPHPTHSALRTVMLTLIVLLFVAGGALLWIQRESVANTLRAFQETYLSGVDLPQIPSMGIGDVMSGEVKANFDFRTTPKFDTASLVATDGFVAFKEIPSDIKPNFPIYKVNTGITNVKNREHFTFYNELSDADKADLKANAFVVKPNSGSTEFFSLYERNRYNDIPTFVTTDSMLHTYHILFDHLLKRLEQDKLAFILHALNDRLVDGAAKVFEDSKKTPWENAARRNLGFFSVGRQLLDPSLAVNRDVVNEVTEELKLIKEKKEIKPSIVINQNLPDGEQPLLEDYTQYIPRGHYDGNTLLEQYFMSMMWYGRMSFRFKNEDEIRSAVLITLALRDAENQKLWSSIADPIDFFVGKGDDIGFREMETLLEEVYGTDVSFANILAAPEKFATVIEKTKTLKSPEINSIPVFDPTISPDRDAEIKSFRFMGQRFTLDAAIFQRLLYREVGTEEKARMLPKGLDIPAAFGSDEALSILTKAGDTDYKNYPENMTKLRTYISELSKETWTQNIYWGWLYTLKTLTSNSDKKGYPVFMQNQAWTRKSLNTFLASWAELKHDTVLYAKQAYAELGGGGDSPTPPDDRGFVEPNVALYARLAGLLVMTREGLDEKKLLSDDMRAILVKMEELTLSLKTISEKELKNEKLTDAEYELIRSYGGQLEHFWMEVNREAMADTSARNYLDENPAALVTDVATDPNGEVLQVGTGYIQDIYVIVPVDGMLKLTRGGVFSYYEFPWSMDDRLTDKKWRTMMGIVFDQANPPLAEDKKPTQPAWTHTFMGEKEAAQ